MNLFYPLVLIASTLQGSSSAGHGQVSAMPAQPELQTLPASETMGLCRGTGWASPSFGFQRERRCSLRYVNKGKYNCVKMELYR